jgi:hypothetical protein
MGSEELGSVCCIRARRAGSKGLPTARVRSWLYKGQENMQQGASYSTCTELVVYGLGEQAARGFLQHVFGIGCIRARRSGSKGLPTARKRIWLYKGQKIRQQGAS